MMVPLAGSDYVSVVSLNINMYPFKFAKRHPELLYCKCTCISGSVLWVMKKRRRIHKRVNNKSNTVNSLAKWSSRTLCVVPWDCSQQKIVVVNKMFLKLSWGFRLLTFPVDPGTNDANLLNGHLCLHTVILLLTSLLLSWGWRVCHVWRTWFAIAAYSSSWFTSWLYGNWPSVD